MSSLQQALNTSNSRPSGFDYLRIILSVAVVCFHSVLACYGPVADAAIWSTWLGAPLRLILPCFFALSGFLVSASIYKNANLPIFIINRIIRIYPALIAEVLLSAILIGPILSIYPIGQYFSDPVFWNYLWNMIGHVHFMLPGLFIDNPHASVVNQQLWTIPFELYCYIALSLLVVVGITRSLAIAVLAPVALTLAYFVGRLMKHAGGFPPITGTVPGSLLVASFLWGVVLYALRTRVPYDLRLFVLCLVAAIISGRYFQYGVLIMPLLSAYIIVYVGLMNPKRITLLKGADYSYGIFLYGFVIQQMVSQLLPWSREWYLNIAISLPLIVAFSYLSWNYIEKPALRLRHIIPNLFRSPSVAR